MLQCTYWTKQKNHKTKDGSQMGICEGQLNLAGACTQGQKKAQRCFIFLLPASAKSNRFQNALLPSDAPLAKESHRKQEPAHVTPTFSHARYEEPRASEGTPGAAAAPHCPWHKLQLSWHSVTSTENFRACDGNWLSWLLRRHVSKIHAQNCSVLDPQSQTARDDFHAPAWENACTMKIKAPGGRFSKACAMSEMHKKYM